MQAFDQALVMCVPSPIPQVERVKTSDAERLRREYSRLVQGLAQQVSLYSRGGSALGSVLPTHPYLGRTPRQRSGCRPSL